MTKSKSDKNTEKKESVAVNIGQLLCEARDNLGLTTENIASELNLANEVIAQIENNVFDQGIPSAFIRGYIKSYATKVGLDTTAVLKEYDLQTGMTAPIIKKVKIISKFDIKQRDINSSNFLVKSISILIIVIFISFAGWEIWKRYLADIINSNYPTQSNNINNVNEIALNTNEPLTALNSDINSNVHTDEQESQTNDAQTEIPLDLSSTKNNEINNTEILNSTSIENEILNTNASSSTSVEQVPADLINFTELVFDFSADCWVKIVDARGEVIALGVKVFDKHMSIEGVAPFNIVLGDASVVTMTVNGVEHDLSSYKNGKRAEFVIE